MAIAATQIIAGMHRARKHTQLTTTLDMVPKKIREPLANQIGTQGWGLSAIDGYSVYRVLIWMGVQLGLSLVFVILWLVLVSKTDPQNAFVPAGMVFMVTASVMGTLQMMAGV